MNKEKATTKKAYKCSGNKDDKRKGENKNKLGTTTKNTSLCLWWVGHKFSEHNRTHVPLKFQSNKYPTDTHTHMQLQTQTHMKVTESPNTPKRYSYICTYIHTGMWIYYGGECCFLCGGE